MPRPKRWNSSTTKHGISHVTLSAWKYFSDYVSQRLLNFPGYVYRGHRSDKWLLESTLDRLLKQLLPRRRRGAVARHLQNFKYAARGRRGNHPPPLQSDDDWWAIGQHHGLATPLLDWTESPYVAAYFSYHELRQPDDGKACVWAVHWPSIEEKAAELLKADPKSLEHISIVRPLSDENARLVNQVGSFMRLPELTDLESWVRKHFDENYSRIVLLKISFSQEHREEALKLLTRMNINHATLFPDLSGSSVLCNNKLLVPAY